MKLSDQVCTLDQAKRLKELGIRQDTLFSWCGDEEQRLMDNGRDGLAVSDWVFIDLTVPKNNQHADGRDDVPSSRPFAAAFTVAELGQSLPEYAGEEWFLEMYKDNETNFLVRYVDHDGLGNMEIKIGYNKNNEAEARAAMLIHLLETKTITAEEVNKRLQQ